MNEKVEGPTSSWVNPLVVVEKTNGDARLCLDMRQANRAIVREKHPVPTVEETLQEVSYAKVFSKLDLNVAFHQIELHPDSRDKTTFPAPNGLNRHKRLLFGVNMATEKFQQIVWQVIKDCLGAYNLHDDLRVVGADDKEHDENLERVMRKLEESVLILNYEKCEIGVSSMVYMGDVLSGEGLRFSSDRVKAIVEAPVPQNLFEVRGFLGSVQFCAKFISNFATISCPLWDLTKKEPSGDGVLSRMKPLTKSKTCWFVHQLWLITNKVLPHGSRLMPRRLELEPFLNRSKKTRLTDQFTMLVES